MIKRCQTKDEEPLWKTRDWAQHADIKEANKHPLVWTKLQNTMHCFTYKNSINEFVFDNYCNLVFLGRKTYIHCKHFNKFIYQIITNKQTNFEKHFKMVYLADQYYETFLLLKTSFYKTIRSWERNLKNKLIKTWTEY